MSRRLAEGEQEVSSRWAGGEQEVRSLSLITYVSLHAM